MSTHGKEGGLTARNWRRSRHFPDRVFVWESVESASTRVGRKQLVNASDGIRLRSALGSRFKHLGRMLASVRERLSNTPAFDERNRGRDLHFQAKKGMRGTCSQCAH